MKLCISGQALGEKYKLGKILSVLNKLGVTWIELWPKNFAGCIYPERFEGGDIREIKFLLREYNIKPACISLPYAFSREAVLKPREYQNALKYTIDVAGELHTRIVNTYFAQFDAKPAAYFVKTVGPAVKYAQTKNIIIVLENEAHDITAKATGMLKILKLINSRHFRTNFDPCNYYHGADEAFPNAYNILKDYIAYVHIKNGCIFNPEFHPGKEKMSAFGKPFRHKYIFYPPVPYGAVNIEGLLGMLRGDRYNGFCALEPHTVITRLEHYYRMEVEYMNRHGVR